MDSDPFPRVDMASRYNPAESEQLWYDYWEEQGYFQPDPGSSAESFVITIPPPNVTGDLHLGHALTYGIEDILGRFKRMQGYNTLILPGTDHAGIATQNVVEKLLASEGVGRQELGRDKFVQRVWEWKQEYANNIRRQFRAMGCSFDWSRERFTMDLQYVDAVLEFFIRLYEEGNIYRGWRVINWCVRCHSAISDIEVEDVAREDPLFYIRYPLQGSTQSITVATVRPETILGDVAVAVNPNDARYRDLIGKVAILPLLGRELTIVGDSFVDMEFGTGAVKITPAHDFADFEVAQRHGLKMPIAIDPHARITEVGGPYAGQTVEEARRNILRDLDAAHLLVKVEQYRHNVPTCERCGTLLEPLLSEQWFMHMDQLAAPAITAVKEGHVTFVPRRWESVYLDWMENIRPWTLSRQLWWGHRIPIYYCENGHANTAQKWPTGCVHCDAPISHQDPDVLDTWFSSALWPIATLGWPRDTEDFKRFYPTSFMNTSSQIIYLWIARMIMTGIKFRGTVPFPVVLINPTILNKEGQRMSKSLGTGVDPLVLIAQYGADALRFGLVTSGSTHQQEIRFSPEKVEQSRNFANKLWNIARAILSTQLDEPDGEIRLEPADHWIISRLNSVIRAVTEDLDRFEFSGAGQQLHDFIWSEFADWYLEIAKLRLYDTEDKIGRNTAQAVLWSVLDRSVRVLHPFMPFLTEEVWQHVRSRGSQAARELSGWSGKMPVSVMLAEWPRAEDRNTVAERQLDFVKQLVTAVRAVRSEYRAEPAKFISAIMIGTTSLEIVRYAAPIVSRLAHLKPVTVVAVLDAEPRSAVSVIVGDVTVYLPLEELTDVAAERDRLTKELTSTEKAHLSVQSKLADQSFVTRAPTDIIVRERERENTLANKVQRLRQRLGALEA
ncbi:MAG: valine--tRNA ligase [Chloroflexota bacterium]